MKLRGFFVCGRVQSCHAVADWAEKGSPGEVCEQLTLNKKRYDTIVIDIHDGDRGSSYPRKPDDKEKFGTDLAGSYSGMDKKIIFADRR